MKRIILCILILMIFPMKASAKSCEICESLGEKGFPEEYREPLCALTILHPKWDFEPLLVTELSASAGENYDFSHVVSSETVRGRSLVTGEAGFEAYRDEAALFDTGYFDATRESVAYFLDTRNFLSEKGVFQFLDIRAENISSQGVKEMLSPSAAGTEEIALLLTEVGEKTGLEPMFLASRLRQEQGAEGSPLLWGTAGTTLSRWYENRVETENGKWIASPEKGYSAEALLGLDGFFNPFHDSASGKGAFEVYYSGALHAKSCGWDTLEKALLGAGEKMRREYVDAFQNTLYLQKWNVDIRSVAENGGSRNFWGQYMQNIGAAKTEGDRLYEGYQEAGRLEDALTFSIPVYEGMGKENPDPAKGACPVFAAEESLNSPHLYLQEVLSPESSAAIPSTERKGEEGIKEEKNEPSLWIGAVLLTAGVSYLAWRLAWLRKDRKARDIRHFDQKK